MTYDHDGIDWDGDEDLLPHEKLEQLQTMIRASLSEAEHLLRGTRQYASAEAYWINQIKVALGIGYTHGTTMQDTINSLEDDV